ncbi:hypothetical protein BpHYR1_049807 [Brachionus plicatilis]|uniref:Uncharacterized protein n=1 Tax=Brachionus plicatilis TaxID=10195 RepID=A0A3M7RKY9_BRAPC|nr:hypothetical protein BpHYR1_049807 [Brachionus plicatilis]
MQANTKNIPSNKEAPPAAPVEPPVSFQEFCLSSSNVFGFTLPCCQHTSLESSAKAKSQSPRSLEISYLIHGVQINRGFFFRLTTGQESNTWYSRRNSSAQSSNGSSRVLFSCVFFGTLKTSSDHVWFQ